MVDGNPGSPAVIASLLLVTYSAAAAADRRLVVFVAALALGVPALVALVATDADAADLLLPMAIFAIPLAAGRAVSPLPASGRGAPHRGGAACARARRASAAGRVERARPRGA